MKKSHLIAGVFAILIVLWMAYGMMFKEQPDPEVGWAEIEPEARPELIYEVKKIKAEPVIGSIEVQGDVMPNREVVLKAQSSGQIREILKTEGDQVNEGDVLVRLEMNTLQARLDKSKARTSEALRKFKAAKKLSKSGYAAKTNLDESFANYKSAQADQKEIELQIQHTEIRAPFSGIIDQTSIQIGSFLDVGSEVVTIVDNELLIVNVHVSQHEIGFLKVGNKATVMFSENRVEEGVIRFIAPRAESDTRTFSVEIEIENSGNLRSGVSVAVSIPKPAEMAHFVSPALLALDEEGNPGVKTVTEQGVVELHQVTIVSSQSKGVFVRGLPEVANVIISGQGYVSAGETIKFIEVEDDNISGQVDAAEELSTEQLDQESS